MDVVALLVVLLAGLVLGTVAGSWVVRRSQGLTVEAAVASAGADAQARLAAAEARLDARDSELREVGVRLGAATAAARDASAALTEERVTRAGLETALREERQHAGEKLALLTAARDELSAHFKALAGDALELNRQRMAEQHHGALDTILKPLGEKLMAFEKKVEDTYDKEAQQRASLKQEVLNLQAATLQINEDAKNLTRALKGEAKTRGNWGEVVLERVLERSGLVKDVEYRTQHMLKSEDGAISRPDIVIVLPDKKHVIIDSKVSLVAYDRYYAAVDEIARDHAGREHVDGMRRHIRSLNEKNYQGHRALDSPDFVVMFVPIEPALGLASVLEPELFLEAWEQRVVMVTPSNLLAMLMTVRTLWQRDKQTRNAIEIAEQAGLMHDQFARLIESFATLGRKLSDAQDAVKDIEHRLVHGPRNLVRKMDQLREMGAKTKRQLSPEILAQSEETAASVAVTTSADDSAAALHEKDVEPF